MPKYLILHHETSWKAAKMANNLDSSSPDPQKWPVLLVVGDVKDEDLDPVPPTAFVYLSQAAGFLASVGPMVLDGQVPETALAQLKGHMAQTKVKAATGKKTVWGEMKQGLGDNQITAVTSEGEKLTFATATKFQLGQIISMNGQEYTITQIGNQKIDPVTGEPQAVATVVMDENGNVSVVGEEVQTIPGLEELPLDPSKCEEKHRIADLGDATEHVLDLERAV